MASLFVIKGRDQGKTFRIRESVVALGRDRSNPIQIRDTEVSRRHAEIRANSTGYDVIDLGSSNGTYVNSRRVDRAELNVGDHLQIGRTLMLFTPSDDDEHSSFELAAGVNIVGDNVLAESRIVKSISQEQGSRIFEPFEVGESPWLARARSNLQIMYRTALAVSHTLDIDRLLHRIMELIFEWVEADRGCVMLADQETDELAPTVRRNRHPRQKTDEMAISRTILDYVMEHKEGVLTSDAREDERFDAAGSIVAGGVREAICVPMQGRYGVVGVIYIDTYTAPGRDVHARHVNRFSEEHLKLMIAIAHQAALAVEDTSYYSALVQAERLAAIGQTIAMLSHHIKNILQGIRGGSYLIEEGLKENEPDIVKKGWTIVDKNQEKISNLVMDMLTYSKERDPEIAPASLNDVAGDVVELMRARAAEANVRLAFEPDPNMPALLFDSDGLHRAILNIVTNAIDACENCDQPRVDVSTHFSAAEEIARVTVADNGEGIAAEDLEKIFSVFVSRKGNRGTGLGLPVSRKILQEHNGDIQVSSEPQRGSRFILEFPAVPAAPTSTGDTIPQ